MLCLIQQKHDDSNVDEIVDSASYETGTRNCDNVC